MIKYSVIVPVYNAVKTLRRCVDSLLDQNYPDAEIILVNDGSTDGSGDLCREYRQKSDSIVYIEKSNGGVSTARNAGLDAANGEYILFVDSDDYVRSDYFAVLDRHGDSKLLAFCHEIIGEDPRSMPELFAQLEACVSFEQRISLLLSSRRIMSPWDKRFRRSVIEEHHIRFPERMHIGEDFNFCMAYAVHCRELEVEKEQIIYNDITGQDSLSRKYRPELDRQLGDAYETVAETIRSSTQPEKLKSELLAVLDYLYAKLTFSCISEEFKQKKLGYLRDHRRIVEICEQFREPLSESRCGIVHHALRLALKWRLYFPFYLVSYMVKGRKYGK